MYRYFRYELQIFNYLFSAFGDVDCHFQRTMANCNAEKW